jgi:hypothetical protein
MDLQQLELVKARIQSMPLFDLNPAFQVLFLDAVYFLHPLRFHAHTEQIAILANYLRQVQSSLNRLPARPCQTLYLLLELFVDYFL